MGNSEADIEVPDEVDRETFYEDRIRNLEQKVKYLEETLKNVSRMNHPEFSTILSPENFSQINELVEEMIRNPDKETIYDLILEGVREIFGFHRMSITEIVEDQLRVKSNYGLPDEYMENLVIDVEDRPGKDMRSALARCAATGETIVISDRSDAPRYNNRDLEEGKTFSFQFLAIPMIVFDEPEGVVTVANDEQSDIYMNDETVKALKFFVNQASISLENAMLIQKREQTFENAILTLADAVEARDHTTGQHASRLWHHAEQIAGELNLSENKQRALKYGCILHDVGKIAIEDDILKKNGSLTEEEYNTIQAHPLHGHRIIDNLDFLEGARDVVRYHHERWDGNGYPEGLEGEDIPLLARIGCIVDAYDVMIHGRPYKSSMTEQEAVVELLECAGGQFDPKLVNVFLKTLPDEPVKKARETYNS
ncbi:MAG: HD-GYP domain-containing protein [bacterium]